MVVEDDADPLAPSIFVVVVVKETLPCIAAEFPATRPWIAELPATVFLRAKLLVAALPAAVVVVVTHIERFATLLPLPGATAMV